MIKELILILRFATIVFAQNQCSYFQYVRFQNQVQGILTLTHDQRNPEHRLKVILTLGAKLPNSYVGDISLLKEKQSAFDDVLSGQPVQYRIRFPLQNPLPKLTSVYYNNQLMCSGQRESAQIVTTITLEHSLISKSPTKYTPNKPANNYIRTTQFPQNYQNNEINNGSQISLNPQYQSQIQVYQNTQPTQNYQISQSPVNIHYDGGNQNDTFNRNSENSSNYESKPSIDQKVSYNDLSNGGQTLSQCGTPHQQLPKHTGLIINGRAALKGQFPWLASYFHNGGDINAFICGASLVSSKAVVTAAHCIHEKHRTPRNAHEAFFYLGKHMVKVYGDEKDFIISPASKFIIHPDWNPSSDSYDADIAIAILSRTIHFTNSIQPICLWSSTTNYHEIANSTGVIVGFGKTEFSVSSSDIPYWTVVPEVDEATCLRSNQGFTILTSSRTFCIGAQDGKGPCNGDSGGGYIKQVGKKWYLRGIISSSIFVNGSLTCDTHNYAVCTDTAAFYSWLIQYI